MTKPVLFVDNDFLIDIYGRQPNGRPWGENYRPELGEAILTDLSKKYTIHITETVLGEAVKNEKFQDMGNWFKKAFASGDAVEHKTPGFTGRDKGERSIASVIEKGGANHDPTLPSNPDDIRIATRDQNFFKNSPLNGQTVTTQSVMEEGLKTGLVSRQNYDTLEVQSGQALQQNRGGFKPAAAVLAEGNGVAPANAAGAPKPASQPVEEPASAGVKPPSQPLEEPVPVAAKTQPAPLARPLPEQPVLQQAAVATSSPSSKFTGPAPEPNMPKPVVPSTAGPVVAAGTSAVLLAGTEKTIVSGFAAVGAVQGTIGTVRAIKNGDTGGAIVNGANAATATTALGVTVAKSIGVEVAPVLESTLGKVNVPLTIATGVYQVATEKGNFIDTEKDGSHTVGHKGERAIAVAATTATGIGLVAAGVSTGGVVPVVAAVAITGEKVIENRRLWNELDHTIEENAAPRKRNAKLYDDDGKPDIRRYQHIFVEMMRVSKDIKTENLSMPLQRTPDGRISMDEFRKLDMRDPKNIAEIERALDVGIAREGEVMKKNDSSLPKWLRFSDSVSKYTMAQMEQADMKGAKTELAMYRKELQEYDAAHPDDPATTPPGGAPQKQKSRTPAPK